MELIIGWLLFAGLCAFIATQKGRNPWVWGLLGLGFSLFAVIAIACAKDLSKSP